MIERLEEQQTLVRPRELIHRANLWWWVLCGLSVSVGTGAVAYEMVSSTGESATHAAMAAAGVFVMIASLYVTASAFINSVREP